MINEEFKHWLNGYITLTSDQVFTKSQFTIIKNHANLVRARVKELEADIKNFLSELENIFLDNDCISINDFLKIARILSS